MPQLFSCFNCNKVLPLKDDQVKKCMSCGSGNGEEVSPEQLKEDLESGAIFSIDLTKDARAKKKRR